MITRVAIQLTNGDTVEHRYPDQVIDHNGVLTVALGRDSEIRYPLTSVLSWAVER